VNEDGQPNGASIPLASAFAISVSKNLSEHDSWGSLHFPELLENLIRQADVSLLWEERTIPSTLNKEFSTNLIFNSNRALQLDHLRQDQSYFFKKNVIKFTVLEPSRSVLVCCGSNHFNFYQKFFPRESRHNN